MCESVSGPEAPKDVTYTPRERRKRAVTGKASILTRFLVVEETLTEVSIPEVDEVRR